MRECHARILAFLTLGWRCLFPVQLTLMWLSSLLLEQLMRGSVQAAIYVAAESTASTVKGDLLSSGALNLQPLDTSEQHQLCFHFPQEEKKTLTSFNFLFFFFF